MQTCAVGLCNGSRRYAMAKWQLPVWLVPVTLDLVSSRRCSCAARQAYLRLVQGHF